MKQSKNKVCLAAWSLFLFPPLSPCELTERVHQHFRRCCKWYQGTSHVFVARLGEWSN